MDTTSFLGVLLYFHLRCCNIGEESSKDDSDSDDFESVLDVDEDGNFFSITQFDKYIWRSYASPYFSMYDFACCITQTKVKKRIHDRVEESNVGRKRLKRYPFEGTGCKFQETLIQIISTSLKVPILAGAPPPGYPGEKPVDGSDDDIVLWEKGARLFVE